MTTDLKLQPRIFIADDEKAFTDAMRVIFRVRGFSEFGACNHAAEVIDEAVRFRPDVFLVDLRWDKEASGEPQELQGDDILRKVATTEAFGKCYVGALTKELNPGDLVAFRGKWGRFDLLLKTPDGDDLIRELKDKGVL